LAVSMPAKTRRHQGAAHRGLHQRPAWTVLVLAVGIVACRSSTTAPENEGKARVIRADRLHQNEMAGLGKEAAVSIAETYLLHVRETVWPPSPTLPENAVNYDPPPATEKTAWGTRRKADGGWLVAFRRLALPAAAKIGPAVDLEGRPLPPTDVRQFGLVVSVDANGGNAHVETAHRSLRDFDPLHVEAGQP
jgi:hypothetical protein